MYLSSLRFGQRMALRGMDEHQKNEQEIEQLDEEIWLLKSEIEGLHKDIDLMD